MNPSSSAGTDRQQPAGWARDLSSRSIKKQLKLRMLERWVGDLEGRRCLEHGTETGVVCEHLRRTRGGMWDAACLDPSWADVAAGLLGVGVGAIDPEAPLPYADDAYDFVLVSRPEHVLNDAQLFAEGRRILAPGGRLVVTTPHDDRGMVLNRVKERVGLTLEAYDHHRSGYSVRALGACLETAGLRDVRVSSYCRFFSESIELAVNALYLKMRRGAAGRGDERFGKPQRNEYRPKTETDARATGPAYTAYRLVYPVLRLVSLLDLLIPFARGYVLVAAARK